MQMLHSCTNSWVSEHVSVAYVYLCSALYLTQSCTLCEFKSIFTFPKNILNQSKLTFNDNFRSILYNWLSITWFWMQYCVIISLKAEAIIRLPYGEWSKPGQFVSVCIFKGYTWRIWTRYIQIHFIQKHDNMCYMVIAHRIARVIRSCSFVEINDL